MEENPCLRASWLCRLNIRFTIAELLFGGQIWLCFWFQSKWYYVLKETITFLGNFLLSHQYNRHVINPDITKSFFKRHTKLSHQKKLKKKIPKGKVRLAGDSLNEKNTNVKKLNI